MINAAAPALTPWVAMWQKAMPQFKVDSLYRTGTSPAFRGGFVQALSNVYPPPSEEAMAFRILSAPSPGGRYNLIFDSYLVIQGNGDEVDISGEPDSAPLLLDLRGGTSNMFDFYGTDGRFQWGAWLSPTRFALAGSRLDPVAGARGWMKLYSLDDSTATMYVTRRISSAEGTKYRASWEEWVTAKYRALKRGKQPS
jgi:hypothetical protein